MKLLTASLLLFFVLMTLTVEADAGSFNLSGFLDPGFTIGRGHHNRRHRSRERNEEVAEDATTDTPKPEEIHNFDVPEAFTHTEQAADNDGNAEEEHPARHHGHRRSHH